MDHKKLQGKMVKAVKRSPVIQALQLTAPLVGGEIRQQEKAHTSFVSLWL
jgi:hypothetical protein